MEGADSPLGCGCHPGLPRAMGAAIVAGMSFKVASGSSVEVGTIGLWSGALGVAVLTSSIAVGVTATS